MLPSKKQLNILAKKMILFWRKNTTPKFSKTICAVHLWIDARNGKVIDSIYIDGKSSTYSTLTGKHKIISQ